MKEYSVKRIVIAALGMALVFLATYLIKIPNGIQGYFNLGDGFIMLFSTMVNPFLAFMIGGVGSALADVAGGYGIYFLPTLLIKGLEAIVIAIAFQRIKSKLKYGSFLLGALIMVCGYLICDSLINASWALGLSGVPANVLQGAIGVGIAILALPLLKHTGNETN